MNQLDYLSMKNDERCRFDAQNYNCFTNNASYFSMLDVNASTETAYPAKNGNSMNKKLESAKKWLKDRKV